MLSFGLRLSHQPTGASSGALNECHVFPPSLHTDRASAEMARPIHAFLASEVASERQILNDRRLGQSGPLHGRHDDLAHPALVSGL